jgi:DNA-directed RNA polymerase specialized sigma24 family protein
VSLAEAAPRLSRIIYRLLNDTPRSYLDGDDYLQEARLRLVVAELRGESVSEADIAAALTRAKRYATRH